MSHDKKGLHHIQTISKKITPLKSVPEITWKNVNLVPVCLQCNGIVRRKYLS